MKPRCPDCDSTWIGYRVPDSCVVVHDEQSPSPTSITLASYPEGRFLSIDDINMKAARCLDCGAMFDAMEGRK